MARQSKVAGTCFIKVDGEQLSVSGGVEVPLTDNEREGINTSAGNYYSEKTHLPYIKATVVIPKGFPVEKIKKSDDMSIVAELANGKTYSLSGAWLANKAAFKGDEGKSDLEFEGQKGEFL